MTALHYSVSQSNQHFTVFGRDKYGERGSIVCSSLSLCVTFMICPSSEDVGTVTSLSDVMTGDSLGQAIVDRAHDSRLGDDSSDVPLSLSTPNSPHNARARARQVGNISVAHCVTIM